MPQPGVTASRVPPTAGVDLVPMSGLDKAAREIGNRLASARRGDEQNRWLVWAGLGGVVLGMLLYALAQIPLALLAPTSWRWPERLATRVLDEGSP